MKIICTTENLRGAVAAVERFTGRHITLPILSHILIKVTDKKILLIATNLEIGIEYQLNGKIQKPGVTTIPAKQFFLILQSLKDEQVTLEAKQNQVTLNTAATSATFVGLEAGDFPNLPLIKREQGFSLPAGIFTQALEQVLPSAATSDIKPELAGVLLSTKPKTITLAATDSFRLAERSITPAAGVGEAVECILPNRAAAELLRSISGEEREIEAAVGEHQIVFSWNGARILSRLIDGAYPPYQNIIPSSYETTLAVNREELLQTIRLAAVFSSRLNDVTLNFSPTGLEVATMNSDSGGTSTRLTAKGRGSSGTVVFNHRFLADGVNAAGGEQVVLHLNGSSGPTLIQNPADPSFRYLLMPIRSV